MAGRREAGSLLLGRAHVAEGAVAAGGLRVLPAHADAPVVAQAAVQAHALHALDVLTDRLIEEIRVLLRGLPVLDVALAIQHPRWDLELQWVADHSHYLVDFVSGQLS